MIILKKRHIISKKNNPKKTEITSIIVPSTVATGALNTRALNAPPQPQQMPLLWPYLSSVSIDSEAVARLTGCPPLDQPALNILVS